MLKNRVMKRIAAMLVAAICFGSIGFAQEADSKVPILVYHNVCAPGGENPNPLLTVDTNKLYEQLTALKNAGYHTITYEDYYNYMTKGTLLPTKPIIITFDDGYLSNYQYAYPMFQELEMKAVIFIITGRMGIRNTRYPHFSWNQAKEMAESGWIDIQSHTNTHPDLVTISHERLWDEMRISKALIEKYMGRICNVIAFPYGSANAHVYWAAQQAGYKMLNIVGDKGVNRKEEGMNSLKRITVNGNWNSTDLLWVLDANMNR